MFAVHCTDTLLIHLKGSLINNDLEWGDTPVDEELGDIYKSYYKKLEPHVSDIVHWFQQLGLMRSKCRNDLISLSNEQPGLRDASSSTRLLDFAKVYEQTLDVLWSEFALFPSATRIGEGFHGIKRNAYNEQTPHDWRDARGRYLAWREYDNRRKRRKVVHERAGKEGKKLKRAAKHRDRGYLVAMIGNQLEKIAKAMYTKARLSTNVLTVTSYLPITCLLSEIKAQQHNKKH